VILEHPGAGAYYSLAFTQDWNRAAGGSVTGDLVLLRGTVAFLVLCLLLGLYLVRRR